jgi:hypothetical protein
MRLIFILILLLSHAALAEIGQVLKVDGDKSSYILRGKNKFEINPEFMLEANDVIHSGNSNLLIHLYPLIQIGIAKNTQIKLTGFNLTSINKENAAWASLEITKGMLRSKLQNVKGFKLDLKIDAPGVSFSIQDGEFEVSLEENQDVDLDVIGGLVSVSSPHIQSFVPEIVKSNESLRFLNSKKILTKRPFAPKFHNFLTFEKTESLLEKWGENRIKQTRSGGKRKVKKVTSNTNKRN